MECITYFIFIFKLWITVKTYAFERKNNSLYSIRNVFQEKHNISPWKPIPENKSSVLQILLACYDNKIADDIQPIDVGLPFAEDTIFFIETSCEGGIELNALCSVEAAARVNPNQNIVVLFLGPVSVRRLKETPSWELLKHENINFFRINLRKYLRDTPLHNILERNIIRNRFVTITHILRFVTLYKYGGIYLDLDVLNIKPLNLLPKQLNWVAKAEDNRANLALFSLSNHGIGKSISNEMLRRMTDNTNQSVEDIFTEVLCGYSKNRELHPENCKGFGVYDVLYFDREGKDFWFHLVGLELSKDAFAFDLRNISFSSNLRHYHCPLTFKWKLQDHEIHLSQYKKHNSLYKSTM